MKRILVALLAVLSVLALCVSCSEPAPKERTLTILDGWEYKEITTFTIKDETSLADLAGKTFTYDENTYTIMCVDEWSSGTEFLLGYLDESDPAYYIYFYTDVLTGKEDWVDSKEDISQFDTLIFGGIH
ncbi:MAG: hypothetical protein KBS81_05980 [Spirochaetales bacterium]|nr:hypothetical protein [Candidatus Physcosoma equi]